MVNSEGPLISGEDHKKSLEIFKYYALLKFIVKLICVHLVIVSSHHGVRFGLCWLNMLGWSFSVDNHWRVLLHHSA